MLLLALIQLKVDNLAGIFSLALASATKRSKTQPYSSGFCSHFTSARAFPLTCLLVVPQQPPSLRADVPGRLLNKLEIRPNPTSAVINQKERRRRYGRFCKLESSEGGGALIFSCQPVCLHPCPENLAAMETVVRTSSPKMLIPQLHYIQLFTVKTRVTRGYGAFTHAGGSEASSDYRGEECSSVI